MTWRAAVVALVALAVLHGPGCADEPRLRPVTDTGTRVLELAGRTVTVELAYTQQAITNGLMERTHLNPDAGMLFVFQETRPRLFWMRNTRIPLDIVFLEEDGTIINVAEAEPLVERPGFASQRPARYVLELARGWCRAAGVEPGQRVTIPEDVPGLAQVP